MNADRRSSAAIHALLFLHFRDRRRQFPRYHLVGETGAAVGAIAKRLVLRMAATAQGNRRPARETERRTGGIADFKVSLNPDRTITVDSYFGRHASDSITSGYFFLVAGGGVVVLSSTAPP
jgi:hypothetical protein